jgi:hypothetical protein
VLLQRTKQTSGLSMWLAIWHHASALRWPRVALANKMARMAWVVLYKGEAYRPPSLPQVIAA